MKLIVFLFFALAALGVNSQNSIEVSTKSTNSALTQVSSNLSFSIEKIFPNPARDFVNVDIRSGSSVQVQLFLFNILGTEIKKWEPTVLHSGQQQLKIDISSIKTGIYILKISGSGQVCSQVFKKN